MNKKNADSRAKVSEEETCVSNTCSTSQEVQVEEVLGLTFYPNRKSEKKTWQMKVT